MHQTVFLFIFLFFFTGCFQYWFPSIYSFLFFLLIFILSVCLIFPFWYSLYIWFAWMVLPVINRKRYAVYGNEIWVLYRRFPEVFLLSWSLAILLKYVKLIFYFLCITLVPAYVVHICIWNKSHKKKILCISIFLRIDIQNNNDIYSLRKIYMVLQKKHQSIWTI